MDDVFGFIANAMSYWSGPKLPPELRGLRGGMIGRTMERWASLGLDGGIYELIGGVIPQECVNPDAALRRAMGEVSAAFFVFEEFRQRGIQIGCNISDPLVRKLVRFFKTLNDPRTTAQVRVMVEAYLQRHSVPAPITVEQFFGVTIRKSPLLTRLGAIERECRRRRKLDRLAPYLDDVGLLMNQVLDESRYNHTTPLNVRTFAHTGGDGVHFGLMVRDGAVSEESPVVVVDPNEDGYVIVGENLQEFLDFGYHTGYFCFQSLVSHVDRDDMLRTLLIGPAACDDFENDFGHTRLMMQRLRAEFHLKPWTDVMRFQALQDRYQPLLVKPPQ